MNPEQQTNNISNSATDPTLAMLGITPEALKETENQQINLKLDHVNIIDHTRTDKEDLGYFQYPTNKKSTNTTTYALAPHNVMEDIYNFLYIALSFSLGFLVFNFIFFIFVYSINILSINEFSVDKFLTSRTPLVIPDSLYFVLGGSFVVTIFLIFSSRKFMNKDASGYFFALASFILTPIWLYILSIQTVGELGNFEIFTSLDGAESYQPVVDFLALLYPPNMSVILMIFGGISFVSLVSGLILFQQFTSYSNSQNDGAYGMLTSLEYALLFLIYLCIGGILVYFNFLS